MSEDEIFHALRKLAGLRDGMMNYIQLNGDDFIIDATFRREDVRQIGLLFLLLAEVDK